MSSAVLGHFHISQLASCDLVVVVPLWWQQGPGGTEV